MHELEAMLQYLPSVDTSSHNCKSAVFVRQTFLPNFPTTLPTLRGLPTTHVPHFFWNLLEEDAALVDFDDNLTLFLRDDLARREAVTGTSSTSTRDKPTRFLRDGLVPREVHAGTSSLSI